MFLSLSKWMNRTMRRAFEKLKDLVMLIQMLTAPQMAENQLGPTISGRFKKCSTAAFSL